MSKLVKIDDIKKMIVPLRDTEIIPDFLVASLYGVQTKDINRAVKNNPDKFPEGYIILLLRVRRINW